MTGKYKYSEGAVHTRNNAILLCLPELSKAGLGCNVDLR